MARRLFVMAAAAVLAACASQAPEAPPAAAAPVVPAPPPPRSGLDLEGFDRNVRPQDDLYRFVGGGWLAKTEIPTSISGKPSW